MLEALLTLFVTCLLILLFSSPMLAVLHAVRGELFVQELESLFKSTQYQAGARGKSQLISVKDGYLKTDYRSVKIPTDEVKITNFSLKYNERAGNSTLDKIIIRLPYEKKTISYQFYMGSGKYKKEISQEN